MLFLVHDLGFQGRGWFPDSQVLCYQRTARIEAPMPSEDVDRPRKVPVSMPLSNGNDVTPSDGSSPVMRSLREHLERVAVRKVELGIRETPESVDAMRNKGGQRTDSKRELLRRTEERAQAAGLRSGKSYF